MRSGLWMLVLLLAVGIRDASAQKQGQGVVQDFNQLTRGQRRTELADVYASGDILPTCTPLQDPVQGHPLQPFSPHCVHAPAVYTPLSGSAFPVLKLDGQTFVAATRFGLGRVVAFGHEVSLGAPSGLLPLSVPSLGRWPVPAPAPSHCPYSWPCIPSPPASPLPETFSPAHPAGHASQLCGRSELRLLHPVH